MDISAMVQGRKATGTGKRYDDTQAIALMKDPKNPRQAFERQSRLLKDAFV